MQKIRITCPQPYDDYGCHSITLCIDAGAEYLIKHSVASFKDALSCAKELIIAHPDAKIELVREGISIGFM